MSQSLTLVNWIQESNYAYNGPNSLTYVALHVHVASLSNACIAHVWNRQSQQR